MLTQLMWTSWSACRLKTPQEASTATYAWNEQARSFWHEANATTRDFQISYSCTDDGLPWYHFRKLTSKEHVFPERFPCADMKQTARLAARLDQKQIDILCRARSPLSHEMQAYTAWSTNFIHTIWRYNISPPQHTRIHAHTDMYIYIYLYIYI